MAASGRNKKILGVVAAVVVAVVVALGVRFAFAQFGGDSKQESIQKTVDQLKEQNELPQQVDEVTTLDDVTAEESAIHYHYTIAGADTSGLTEDALRESVLPQLCSTAETKDLLDQDVEMKYSYEVAETGDTYDLSFSKSDC